MQFYMEGCQKFKKVLHFQKHFSQDNAEALQTTMPICLEKKIEIY